MWIIGLKGVKVLSWFLLLEWKSCEHSADVDKLSVANSLLLSWLGENLMKLKEKQLCEMVS